MMLKAGVRAQTEMFSRVQVVLIKSRKNIRVINRIGYRDRRPKKPIIKLDEAGGSLIDGWTIVRSTDRVRGQRGRKGRLSHTTSIIREGSRLYSLVIR
eukprot:scaffold24060_cov50-Attheya_sp.AAC.3